MSEYIADTFEHNGLTVKLIQDEDAESPDSCDDNGLFIVTTRNRYFQLLHDNLDAGDVMKDKALCKQYWIFPLRAYIHGDVALSLGSSGQFSDPWDSGQIGFVFAKRSEWRYRTRERKRCVSALNVAACLVETWNQYLSGDVYGAVVSDCDGNTLDSLWGLYGLEYARLEGKDMADSCAASIATVSRMERESYAI